MLPSSRESWRSWRYRWLINLWPCYLGTGARIVFLASDWRSVRVKVPLSWRTRNAYGTHFGGSLYAAIDPLFVLMFRKVFGPGVAVWDKAASIRFKRPGRSHLFADLRVEEGELEAIRRALAEGPKVDRTYLVELKDARGEVHATVEKVVHFKRLASDRE
jgi:acyl-coenzyme A thioesterase PaaI-like protein